MWSKFSDHNLLSLVLKDQKLFLSLTGRVPLIGGNIAQEFTICSSKGQALQFAYSLDFLSIQTYRLWIEYPSRGKDDLSQIETRDIRLCEACRAEPHERDKFCRRCGARLDASGRAQSASAASSARITSSLSQDMYTLVSGRLLAVAVSGISPHIAPLHNRLFKWLISALLSIPIWLIIVLLSPIDAYTTVKTISKQI